MAKTLNKTPEVLGNDKIAILDGTGDEMPSQVTLAGEGATRIEECVNKMPQFFPDREKIDYKVLADKQSRSLLGARGSIDGAISAYYTSDLLAAHKKMVEFSKGLNGAFWLVWYIDSENRTVAVKATCDDHLKTPEDESGSLNLKEIQISNVSEAIEQEGDAFTVA